jgi:hypothetical protein
MFDVGRSMFNVHPFFGSLSSRSYVCFFIFFHSMFDVGRSMFNVHPFFGSLSSRSYVCFFIFFHSMFDVGRSMFNVQCSCFLIPPDTSISPEISLRPDTRWSSAGQKSICRRVPMAFRVGSVVLLVLVIVISASAPALMRAENRLSPLDV